MAHKPHMLKKFGYKAHVVGYCKTGLLHTVKITAANVHDVTVTQNSLIDKGNFGYSYSRHLGAYKQNAVVRNQRVKKSDTKSTYGHHK